jgi:hypothetical protein
MGALAAEGECGIFDTSRTGITGCASLSSEEYWKHYVRLELHGWRGPRFIQSDSPLSSKLLHLSFAALSVPLWATFRQRESAFLDNQL